jgi:glutathione S-transferase
MRLYYVPMTRATRPRWMLEELGVPYELVRLDRSKAETRTAEHRARHPLGHVPVLEDGDVRIFESAAICLWLGERFPEKGLLPPPGTPGRALGYQWLFYAVTELEPHCSTLSAQNRKPEAERNPALVSEAKEKFRAAATVLGPAVARGHLLGEAFGVADVVVGAILLWGKGLGALQDLPAVEAYLARLKDRPAWKRAIAD